LPGGKQATNVTASGGVVMQNKKEEVIIYFIFWKSCSICCNANCHS